MRSRTLGRVCWRSAREFGGLAEDEAMRRCVGVSPAELRRQSSYPSTHTAPLPRLVGRSRHRHHRRLAVLALLLSFRPSAQSECKCWENSRASWRSQTRTSTELGQSGEEAGVRIVWNEAGHAVKRQHRTRE